MKANVFICVFVIILIIVGIFLIIKFYHKPQEQEIPKTKIFLESKDITDDSRKSVDYTIAINNRTIKTGKTSEKSLEEINLEITNNTYSIFYNGSPLYYNHWIERELKDGDVVTLELRKIGKLNVSVSDNIIHYGENEFVVRTSVEDGYWRGLIVCLDYSINIVYAEIDTYVRTARVKNWLKCYDVGKTLTPENPNFWFKVKYNTRELNEYDYINIILVDRDILYPTSEYHVYNPNNWDIDLGGKNQEITLRRVG